jgi:hypothetical protein
MMDLTYNFRTAATHLPRMENEEDVTAHAFGVYEFFKSYLSERNYFAPLAGLDLLMKKKVFELQEAGRVIRVRRDGKTPDFLHELRIALSVVADHEDGLIPVKYMEPLLTLAFTHDMGEDFNIFADSYAKFMNKTAKNLSRGQNSRSISDMADVEYLAMGMERLTFDRKFTPEQMAKEVGLRKRQAIEVTPKLLDLLLDKIESNSLCVNGYLPKMKYLDQPDSGGRFVYSRFIDDGILDWIEYGRAFRNDPNTGLIKMKDRNDGLGTRIGQNFDIEKYSHYLSKSFHIFSTEKTGENMAGRFRELGPSFISTDKMLGALHRIGRTYVEVHPLKNPAGSKGFQVDNLSEQMDFRDYFPGAYHGYRKMMPGTMPLNIILNRIRTEPSLNGHGAVLYDKFVKSIEHNIQRNSPRWFNDVNQIEMKF